MNASDHLLLAVDTSGARAGLVLAGDGRCETKLLARRPGGFARTEDLAAETGDLLTAWGRKAADLTMLGAVVGPGSYTGLRSGLAFVRGLAFAQGLPAVGVGTLELLAWQVARRGEQVAAVVPSGSTGHALGVYAREGDLVEERQAPALIPQEALPVALKELAGGLAGVAVGPDPAPEALSGHPDEAAEPGSPLFHAARAAGLDLREGAGDALASLAELILAKHRCQGGSHVDTLLPIYVGETRARPNRDRVAVGVRSE